MPPIRPGDEEWRRARRAVARRYHPDVGGDPEVYQREMRAVDSRFGGNKPTAGRSPSRRSGARLALVQRVVWRARRGARLRVRSLRAALPARWPGSRRFIDL
jgi:hypothetical protein